MPAIDQLDTFRGLLERHGWGDKADAILALAKPAVTGTLSRCADDDLPIGCTKIGGGADMPVSMEWPHRSNERPLQFIAQFDCSEIKRIQPDIKWLPKTGLLSFFYDTITQPWGHDPDDRDACRVVFHGSGTSLERREAPAWDPQSGLEADDFPYEPYQLLPCKLGLHSAWTPPHGDSLELTTVLDVKQRISFLPLLDDWLDSFPEPEVQIGGHPSPVQGEMRGGALAPANAWIHVLQLDSEMADTETHGCMWGDSGKLYFWTHQDSLRDRTFAKSEVILQCC